MMIRLAFLMTTLFLFNHSAALAQEQVPIVEGERIGENYALIRINTTELDSVVADFADTFLDSAKEMSGIILDIRTLWLNQDSIDSAQKEWLSCIIDSVRTGPLVVLTMPRQASAEMIRDVAQYRPSTDIDYSGEELQARRTLKATIRVYEQSGLKQLEENKRKYEEYLRQKQEAADSQKTTP